MKHIKLFESFKKSFKKTIDYPKSLTRDYKIYDITYLGNDGQLSIYLTAYESMRDAGSRHGRLGHHTVHVYRGQTLLKKFGHTDSMSLRGVKLDTIIQQAKDFASTWSMHD